MAVNSGTGSAERGTYQIRALDRGLDILEAFSLSNPELSIGDIAARTGLPKPTIVRLLSVLTGRSYVERVVGAERYRLGVRTLEIGSVYLQSTSMEAEARPVMMRLAEKTGQTANLGILDNDQVVHIEVVPPDRPVRFWASIGKREDAYVSGLGKILLASLPLDARNRYLQRPRTHVTVNTIVEANELAQELDRTASRGYAIDNEESSHGVVCIAAPIWDRTNRVVAAVSISGAKAEFQDAETMSAFIQYVKNAAAQISARLGWSADA
jgi:DNA-binding IclR family transcriptional regulator